MVKFHFSVTNGHYKRGSVIELPENTAKVFEKLKWGSIQNENEPKPKSKAKSKKS